MNRKLYLLLILLLAALAGGTVAAAPAGQTDTVDPAAADATAFMGDEPNDTFATATPLSSADYLRIGYFITPADVDIYRLPVAQAGWNYFAAHVEPNQQEPYYPPGSLQLDLALFNAAGVQIVATGCGYSAELEPDLAVGAYYLRVRRCGAFDIDRGYQLQISHGLSQQPPTEKEPNNTLATATPIVVGQTVYGTHDSIDQQTNCSDDWYRFKGRAGDVFAYLNIRRDYQTDGWIYLYDGKGNRLTDLTLALPADGTYYLKVNGFLYDSGGNSFCPTGDYRFVAGESLWVSATVDGLGGATVRRGDIVTRGDAPGAWRMVFDASDVGLTANLTAFERLPNGTILMSLGAAQIVPGLGTVTPQDIIRFVPTSLGATTAGSFLWYLDGSDVGLTLAGERIDAIFVNHGDPNPLRISTVGAASVPKQSGGTLAVADEDFINFVGTQYGATSAGKWRVNLDGSAIAGLAAENITAATRINLWPGRYARVMVSLVDAFAVGGFGGGPRDVLDLGETGSWPQIVNGGIAIRAFTSRAIDGLSVGPVK